MVMNGPHLLFYYLEEAAPRSMGMITYKLDHDMDSVQQQFFVSAFEKLGNKVLSGLFSGMELDINVAWSDGNIVSKLLGMYEVELEPHIKQAIARKPKTIANIGCAEGYYTIGLARLLPDVKVLGYDICKDSLKLAWQNARQNKVNNVSFWLVDDEYYNFYDLAAIEHQADLIIMDCESGERAYLHEVLQPVLQKCDIIVECHDFMLAGISDDIIKRFQESHRIEVIKPVIPAPRRVFDRFDLIGQTMPHIALTDFHFWATIWLVMWSKERDQALSA